MSTFLHPDKIVALNDLISKRPKRPIAADRQKEPLTPQALTEAPSLLADMAFRLHDQHWDSHLSRVARLNGAIAAAGPPAPPKEVDVGQTQQAQPSVVIQLAAPKRNA